MNDFLFSPPPPPSTFFFCSRSNFRAITRLETPATQANSQMAKKATSRLGNSLTGTPPRGKPFPLYGSRSKVCHHSCHPTKSCEIKKKPFFGFLPTITEAPTDAKAEVEPEISQRWGGGGGHLPDKQIHNLFFTLRICFDRSTEKRVAAVPPALP